MSTVDSVPFVLFNPDSFDKDSVEEPMLYWVVDPKGSTTASSLIPWWKRMDGKLTDYLFSKSNPDSNNPGVSTWERKQFKEVTKAKLLEFLDETRAASQCTAQVDMAATAVVTTKKERDQTFAKIYQDRGRAPGGTVPTHQLYLGQDE